MRTELAVSVFAAAGAAYWLQAEARRRGQARDEWLRRTEAARDELRWDLAELYLAEANEAARSADPRVSRAYAEAPQNGC